MIDKHRQRHLHTPQGFLPNWVLVAFAGAAVLIAGLAQTLI